MKQKQEIRYNNIDLNKLSVAEIAEVLPYEVLDKFKLASVLDSSLSLIEEKTLTINQQNKVIDLAQDMYLKNDWGSLIDYCDSICMWLNKVKDVDRFLEKIQNRKNWKLVYLKMPW